LAFANRVTRSTPPYWGSNYYIDKLMPQPPSPSPRPRRASIYLRPWKDHMRCRDSQQRARLLHFLLLEDVIARTMDRIAFPHLASAKSLVCVVQPDILVRAVQTQVTKVGFASRGSSSIVGIAYITKHPIFYCVSTEQSSENSSTRCTLKHELLAGRAGRQQSCGGRDLDAPALVPPVPKPLRRRWCQSRCSMVL